MFRRMAAYGLLTFAFVGLMAWALAFGQGQHPGAGPKGAVAPSLIEALSSPLSLILVQICLIVMVARLTGYVFQRLHQPEVVGEMFAGIALGPSLLGMVWPDFSEVVFEPSSLPNLSILSQIGVILFMFVVGMELDLRQLRERAATALLVSHTSIFLPFLLGLVAAPFLFREYAGAETGYIAFALFMGISMSVTAFPVLARILKDRGLVGTQLGSTALTCASVGDVTAWCVLAVIVAASAERTLAGSLVMVGLAVAFVLVAFFVFRPVSQRIVDRLPDPARPGPEPVLIVLLGAFLAALATELIGLHALFGAFVAGVAAPWQQEFRSFVRERLEYFSSLFLLPVFFAFTGLRTELGLIQGGGDWLVFALILGLAVAGKFGGAALAARATGVPWRESLALGALMNTRGLMELIVLNIGLDLGVFSPKVFSMLVLMALVTTFATGPVLAWLGYGRTEQRERAEATA